jgi:proline iminopeptidase
MTAILPERCPRARVKTLPEQDIALYPPRDPTFSGTLPVSALHTLYWEESGAADGIPILYLHGGPGAGAAPASRQLFDPNAWRLISFDQRGAGRSTPLGETRENTTADLIADIETLRIARGVDSWFIFGGSWGSTLALAYAETYPERCRGLVLRGICLMRRHEIDWFLTDLRRFFPDRWEAFVALLPEAEREHPLDGYLRLLQSDDAAIRQKATLAWLTYESACACLLPPEGGFLLDLARRSALPVIEAHYFKNNLFAPEDKLLRDIGKIRHLPGVIVQGRYDMICPVATAYELHRAWPEATLRIVPDAGHAMFEPGIRLALMEALAALRDLATRPQ